MSNILIPVTIFEDNTWSFNGPEDIYSVFFKYDYEGIKYHITSLSIKELIKNYTHNNIDLTPEQVIHCLTDKEIIADIIKYSQTEWDIKQH